MLCLYKTPIIIPANSPDFCGSRLGILPLIRRQCCHQSWQVLKIYESTIHVFWFLFKKKFCKLISVVNKYDRDYITSLVHVIYKNLRHNFLSFWNLLTWNKITVDNTNWFETNCFCLQINLVILVLVMRVMFKSMKNKPGKRHKKTKSKNYRVR